MITIDPKEIPTGKLFGYLTGSIAPRPIAFASTIDRQGNVNLSPFSFFNAFGANPPTLIFSPSRRVRDNTTKHTLENVIEVPEVAINMVDYSMVQQMSLASTEYAKGVNEFIKSGLTQIDSVKIRPPRVEESPVVFECEVKDILHLGTEGGAGNLVICEIVLAHFSDHIFDDNGKIDPYKLDPVARLGGNWYSRARGDLFEVAKPLTTKGIGVDNIPSEIRFSQILTGNDLGMLGNVESLPSKDEIDKFINGIPDEMISDLEKNHLTAQKMLEENRVMDAWKILLARG